MIFWWTKVCFRAEAEHLVWRSCLDKKRGIQKSTVSRRSFFPLWAASGMSNLADGVGLTAAPLLAAKLSRDPMLLSGLTIAQRLPWFLFTLISGALVDRLDRRRVMYWANLWRFVLLALLGVGVLLDWADMIMLYGVLFLIGTIETFFDNAAQAILPAIVLEDELEEANGRLFATGSIANELVGPPLGSTLFSFFNSISFFAASFFYGLSSILIYRLSGPFTSWNQGLPQGLYLEIRKGVRWLWGHRLLRTIGFFAACFNFVSAATAGIFVLFAQDVLGMSEAAYGVLLASGAVGGIGGSLLAEGLSGRIGPGQILFLDAFLSGLGFIGIGLTRSPLVVGVMYALISMMAMFGNVVVISLRQAIIPEHLLGRVSSAYRLVVLGALPLGALFGGLSARPLRLTTPILIGGALLVMVAFAMQPVVNNRTIEAARAEAKQRRGEEAVDHGREPASRRERP